MLNKPTVDTAAKSLVQPQSPTWVVVGDLAKIETKVQALKLGEAQVLNGNGKINIKTP